MEDEVSSEACKSENLNSNDSFFFFFLFLHILKKMSSILLCQNISLIGRDMANVSKEGADFMV